VVQDAVPVIRGPVSDGLKMGKANQDRGGLPEGLAAGRTINGRGLQMKLPPNEFTTLILKARGPRRGALGYGGPVLRPAA